MVFKRVLLILLNHKSAHKHIIGVLLCYRVDGMLCCEVVVLFSGLFSERFSPSSLRVQVANVCLSVGFGEALCHMA